MDMLKKYFPFAFTPKADVTALVVNIIIHLVAGFIIGAVIGLLAAIPVLGWIIGILGGLIDLYIFVSLVLTVLDYLKVLK